MRGKRLAKSFISACISDQLIRLGVGTKVGPLDKSLISVFESCAVERLMTVSFCSPGGLDELFERVLRFFLFWLVEVSILTSVCSVEIGINTSGVVLYLDDVILGNIFSVVDGQCVSCSRMARSILPGVRWTDAL